MAQRNAEETSRKFELIAREIEQGLIVFNPQGYISFSNPLVRKMLVIDTWSRRRYSEIFHEIPALSDLIRASLESGAEVRKTSIEIQLPDGKVRRIEASVLPTRDRAGAYGVRHLHFLGCSVTYAIGPTLWASSDCYT